MRLSRYFILGLYAIFSSQLLSQNSAYDKDQKSSVVHVKMLVLSTAVHQNFAGNQDVYIAEVTSGKMSHQVVKLVDTYPSYDKPIRPDLLVDKRSFRVKLSRDHACDGAFVGPRSRIFDASLLETLKADQMSNMPCYRIDHSETRLEK